MKKISLIIVLLFATQSLINAQAEEKRALEQASNIKEITSLIHAFMAGKLRAEKERVHYSHYSHNETAYMRSLKDLSDILTAFHSLMSWKRSGWELLPIERELCLLQENNNALIHTLSHLTEAEKFQIQLGRFYDFMKNTDLQKRTLTDDEKKLFIENRLQLKRAVMEQDPQKINAACVQKLSPKTIVNIDQYVHRLKEKIEKKETLKNN